MRLNELKLGIYEKALPPFPDWGSRLALAEKLGFQFVEMSIDETDERLGRLSWNREERRAFMLSVADSPLSVPSICFSGHRRFPLGSRDPAIREKAASMLRDAITLAADTGIRTIQLAGYDVYYEPADADTWKRFVEGLSAGLRLAARENVMLSMEIMDTKLMSSIVRFLNLKKILDSPWFTVYPDLGNLSAWGNDVQEELKLGSGQIAAVHLKDTLAVAGDFPGQFRDVPFGSGCVDFAAAFRTLGEIGYSGPFLLEMWTEKSDNPEQEIMRAKEWIIGKMKEGAYLET